MRVCDISHLLTYQQLHEDVAEWEIRFGTGKIILFEGSTTCAKAVGLLLINHEKRRGDNSDLTITLMYAGKKPPRLIVVKNWLAPYNTDIVLISQVEKYYMSYPHYMQ